MVDGHYGEQNPFFSRPDSGPGPCVVWNVLHNSCPGPGASPGPGDSQCEYTMTTTDAASKSVNNPLWLIHIHRDGYEFRSASRGIPSRLVCYSCTVKKYSHCTWKGDILCVCVCVTIDSMLNFDAGTHVNAHANVTCKQSFNGNCVNFHDRLRSRTGIESALCMWMNHNTLSLVYTYRQSHRFLYHFKTSSMYSYGAVYT